MLEYKKFSQTNKDETIKRPVLISSITESVARNGKAFVRIGMLDGETEQSSRMFDTTCEKLAKEGITKHIIADAEISVEEYKNEKSFRIVSIKPTSDKSLKLDDFILTAPIDPDVMYDEICSILNEAAVSEDGKTPLAQLVLDILSDNKEKYMSSSASKNMHHNFKGGLLYHSYRMVKAAAAICEVYDLLDKELLVCGAAIHDIGKIWEYKTSYVGDAEYTSAGVLFGHIYMGASLIKQYSQNKTYNQKKVQLLTHMILSHHGTQEWGAVACPATAESFALHYIDNLDAKMNMCESIYQTINPGQVTEKKPFGLDNRIFRPDL